MVNWSQIPGDPPLCDGSPCANFGVMPDTIPAWVSWLISELSGEAGALLAVLVVIACLEGLKLLITWSQAYNTARENKNNGRRNIPKGT